MTCLQPVYGSRHPLDPIMRHHIIGGMVGLGYWDEFFIISALVRVVAY